MEHLIEQIPNTIRLFSAYVEKPTLSVLDALHPDLARIVDAFGGGYVTAQLLNDGGRAFADLLMTVAAADDEADPDELLRELRQSVPLHVDLLQFALTLKQQCRDGFDVCLYRV